MLEAALNRLLPLLGEVFGAVLRCALVKGSALKGDFIPGYSDLDLHVFLAPEAMSGGHAPRRDLALRFQALVGNLEPREYGFDSFQICFIDWERYPEDWVRPFPGSYRVLLGELPPGFTEVRAEEYYPHCAAHLEQMGRVVEGLTGRLVDKPDRSLPPLLRLAGTELKGAIYCAATLALRDPKRVWFMPLDEVIGALRPHVECAPALARFFAEARQWEAVLREPDRVRTALGLALDCLEALHQWHQDTAG